MYIMRFLRQFPGIMMTILHTVWTQRRAFGLSVVVSALLYHVLIVLILSQGLTAPPTYFKVYNVPRNVLTLWRSTPAWDDVLTLLEEEAVFEFGRTMRVFQSGQAVAWSYVGTVHALVDTGVIFLVLASYIAVLCATRDRLRELPGGTCPGLTRSIGSSVFLGLVGTGTGAACCGAVSLSLLATISGATASTVALLATYEEPLIALGYLLLGGSLVHQAHHLRHITSTAQTQSVRLPSAL